MVSGVPVVVTDCFAAALKAIKKNIGGTVSDKDDEKTLEIQFTNGGKGEQEIAENILLAMVKASCGAEKGTTNVPSGEILVDGNQKLKALKFNDVVNIKSFNFKDLPDDNAGISAVAEATYIRHLQKNSKHLVYAINNFPKCLLQGNQSRLDVSIAGFVLFSLSSKDGQNYKLKLFSSCINSTMSTMCSASFAKTVLPKEWSSFDKLEPHQVSDLLEENQERISEYWNDSAQDDHAKTEVTFLMGRISSDLCDYFRVKSKKAGGCFKGDKNIVEQALGCIQDWIAACFKLTTIDWASQWGPEPYKDEGIKQVAQRLQSIIDLRDMISEVEHLLEENDFKSLKTSTLWDVFGGVDIFSTNPPVQKKWEIALHSFNRRLEPLEHRCASALRQFFSNRGTLAPHTVFHEFSDYQQLIKRPIIAKEIVAERDGFLAKLNERLHVIRMEFEHRAESAEEERVLEKEDEACQTGRFMPGVVNNIIWLRQLRGKIEAMSEMCKTVLSDLGNASSFIDSANQLLEEIEDYERETFTNWAQDAEDNKDVLTLDSNAPLMDIDTEGRVEVNYSERLVQLIKEVRIFLALGYRVPPEIVKISKKGLQFFEKGVALKQVANVYNSMTEDIIPCTRAMLFEPAVAFEKVITASDSSKLTWKSKEDADKFIRKLQKASSKLNDANRRIHKLHDEIKHIVLELFDMDLLKSRDRWVAKVRVLREKVETCGFHNTETWREFWDMQLYKALESQYKKGLESLHESIGEIKADVVFDNVSGEAALRPSLELIRQQYYLRIKDFITFPLRFQGCSEESIFTNMPSMNEVEIFSVMQHASNMFKKVQLELKRFNPMLVIGRCGKAGNPTLEEIVGASLTEVQHWEQGFRLMKQKGKEINSEELFIKCGCISMCTAGIKGTVEEHLSKLTEALKNTLKQSAEKHLVSIDAYLTSVGECLDKKLTKLDEIGEANILYGELMEQRPSKEVEFHHFYNKNVLLQSMTGQAGLDFTKTKEIWDKYMKRLDSHEKEVEEQLGKLKSTVEDSVKNWHKDVERFANQWHELKPKDVSAPNPLQFVEQKREEFKTLKETGDECVKQCQYFQLDEPDTQPLEDLEEDINDYFTMWSMLGDFQGEVQTLCNETWISFRSKIYKFEDFVKHWQDKLKEIQSNPVTVHIRTMLEKWGRCVPLLKYVRGEGFTPSHWSELFSLLKLRNVTQDTVLFGQLLDKYETLLKNEADIKKLHSRAQGEAQIREALDDVRAWGTAATFSVIPHPDRPGVVLITDWKDTLSALSDNQALLTSMKESPYFKLFSSDALKWDERLTILDEYLRHMNQIQRKWVYLEPIFRRGALPEEQDRFNRIDKEYLNIMSTIAKDNKLMSLAAHTEFKEVLKNVLEQLDRCQKSLNQFLEEKRDSFPRFYFISDDDLLEILAQSKNPTVIQSHLKKLFMGIHSVQFDNQKDNILKIFSLEGEIVPLEKPVRVTDEVETWLSLLDVEMKNTLQAHLARCVVKGDIGAYASQILCTAEMVNFTRKAEDAIRDSKSGALPKLKASLQNQLRELTAYAGGNSDPLIGIKLKALIMDLIHNIDVVDLLITHNVEKETDWYWRKQLRYYLDSSNKCVLRMVDAEFKYSYEYQGNAPKLVHTPLTDRCYLTLTQGMQLGYGGNPYGPAGTGKTESVKALGNAMGRQVLVFNCDEGIDFKSMGRIFTGLVKCGAWGCFDEFNRLKVDQLSAISQMIQVIQEALKNGDDHCQLLGRDINVNENAGIFVTLNPAGKGYGGRSELPDNLKQLFRSIAMSIPDNELITETILYSEGFEFAKDLAKKIVEIFKLSKQLLSFQQHYDWGLRAMKAVLRLGGTLIHSFLMERVAGNVKIAPKDVLMKESEIIIKSLRVNTLSKLTFNDSILFNKLLLDVFPGVPVNEIDYKELRPAIEQSIADLKLQPVESQILKILQLYEALRQRMGVVLVGPSGSGKSTLLKVLRKALQRLGKTVPLYIVNPKALPRDQLLGRMDPDTREWYDGVITDAAKKVVKEETTVQSWIFCDGDIDPEWIESLNSVLDDNKLLTMPNGVRIQFGDNVNFLFETHSLEFASPATVSRMGIIYLSEEDVDPKTAVASWIQEQPESKRQQLQEFIDAYFYKAIDALIATESLIVETTRTGLVMSGLSQLSECTTRAQFALALIYGLGSYLQEEKRKEFAKDVLYLVGEKAPDPKNPLDFKYDRENGGFCSFELDTSTNLTVDELYRHPMIPTVECQRALEVMKAWSAPVKSGLYRPFIIVGPEGCGKTMLLTNLFTDDINTKVATINCSAQTEALHVIQKLKQSCQMFNSTGGKVLRPKEAERLVLLLKDLNLPKPDKYGTVQLHSFLQQLILYRGFYDDDLEWVTVERVQIVGSMNPPNSMGRYPVAPRFLAITSVLSVSYPPKESLQLIYTEFFNIMIESGRLQFNIPSKGPVDIARVMTTIYELITAKFTVDVASHYIFNPRDITKWALNLLNYSPEDLGDALAYEGRRIFVDRLVATEDRIRLSKVIKDNLIFLVGHKDAPSDKESKYYVSWLDGAPSGKKKLINTSMEDLKKSAEVFLINYSRENADLDVQLIPEVCAWLARVDRVLSQERGNLLLIGRSGVCASEIVRLVSYNSRMELVTLGVTRDYNMKQFNSELKSVMTKAGVEGQSTVLLLEDFNFFNPHFLESINSLLSAGEIPGLFTPEEQEALLGPLKEDAIGEGLTPYLYFVERIMRYLHIAIVMDPTNRHYEPQCRSNPALFTRCNVYWMGTWDSGSLKVIPRLLTENVYKDLDSRPDKKEFSLTSELVHMHKGFSDKFSPQHFKVLCLTYESLYNQKRNEVTEGVDRLKTGVSKLDEAQANVDTIASDVGQKKELLEVKQREADEALKEIQAKMEESGEQKRSINKIQKELDKEQQAIKERKVVIEGRLSGIQPVLDSARSAVSSIRSEHLSELKSMKQPPAAVQDVMEGVIILISAGKGADTTWAGIRKILAGDIKGQILNFDLDNVDNATRDKVDKFIESKNNSFKKEVIGRASKAAAPMAEWLKAVIEYSKVLETVAPMRNELKAYEENLRQAQEKKNKYEAKLAKVEEKVEKLKARFAEKTTEAERLRNQLEEAEHLLENATQLITKLSSEHKRWEEQVKGLVSELDLLPKRCLLAAGFVTYLGAQPENTREQTLKEWKEKVKLDEFNFFKFLREESVQLHYKAEGLPGDELSMDNAVIIQEQICTPLIEDPSGLATKWLYQHLKAKGDVVEQCSVSEERLVSTLELALRFGKKIILTDVDKIDPFIYPILRKEIHNEGTKRVIQIGDRRTVDYADGFQLYLVTRSTDMLVPPDILSYLTPVSFSITLSGLEGQFLGLTIQHEQPELEKEKLSVLQKEESLKIQLADLEQSLLHDLANAEGSLLENVGLIESLNKIKSQASEISEALEKSKEVQQEIDNKRNVYRPFAAVASRVFFLTKNLIELSHMYQFSFNLFMDIFKKTLHQQKELRTDPETKIGALSRSFIQNTVRTISGSLLKEHRVVFGIHLSRSLFPEQCTDAEWDYFLDKAIAPDGKKSEVRVPSFVLQDSIDMFRTFGALFPDLVTKIRLQEADVWLQWMRTSSPETDYPSFLQSLTLFQKLLIMKTFRSDRLTAAMNLVACELLNVDSLADNESLATLVKRTQAETPILLITSAGADPSLELQNIAYDKVGKEHFHQLAMGGGQTDAAMELVRSASEKGEWVFLKNLHLVIPWVHDLQKELSTFKTNSNFRLFLTTEPHHEFPSILLSQCLKVSLETPPGIKQNLLRTYGDWGKTFYDSKEDKQKELLFITASLHAIIQERRSYTPQGWTKAYEITASDLKSATDIVLRQSKGEIDWKSIQGLLENAIYGGKMETAFDTRILETYVRHFFRSSSLTSAKKQDSIFAHVRVPGGGFSEYVNTVKGLPDNDTPALFALPPNADRVVQISRVREIIDNLQSINETRQEETMDREEWIQSLTPILNTWSTLVAQNPDVLSKTSPASSLSEAKPIEGFLYAEMESAHQSVLLVNGCVEELKKVTEGTTLLTESRKSEAAAMISGAVPAAWEDFFPSNEKVLPWMQSLIRRATAIAQFQKSVANGTLMKLPINVSLLFRPQTFLNALRQETAHLAEMPLVNLTLVASLVEAPASAKLPVCLEGVLLQGAVTDASGKLVNVETADEAAVFPVQKLFVAWVDLVTENKDSFSVTLPVYANTTKENFICNLSLPCASEHAISTFILAGAALVLAK